MNKITYRVGSISVIAGAIIQRLLDQGLPTSDIFTDGTFTVQ